MELRTAGNGVCGIARGLGVMLSRLLMRRGLMGLLAGCRLGGRGSGLDPWKAGSRDTELRTGSWTGAIGDKEGGASVCW